MYEISGFECLRAHISQQSKHSFLLSPKACIQTLPAQGMIYLVVLLIHNAHNITLECLYAL